jgi:hypothetical protein
VIIGKPIHTCGSAEKDIRELMQKTHRAIRESLESPENREGVRSVLGGEQTESVN